MIHQFHLLIIHPKELKTGSQRGICRLMFVAVLFVRVKIWKQSKYPLMNEDIKYGLHTQWNIIQLKKERNSDTCYNMKEP